MNGIANHEIIKSFSKEENEDIQKQFVAVFPSNFINCFISFHCYERELRISISFFDNEHK